MHLNELLNRRPSQLERMAGFGDRLNGAKWPKMGLLRLNDFVLPPHRVARSSW